MLKMLNYLLLSICHNVGKISTMYYNVVKLVLCITIYVLIRTMQCQVDPLILNTPHHIKHLNIPHHIKQKRIAEATPSY